MHTDRAIIVYNTSAMKYFVIAGAEQFIMLQSLNSLELDQGNYKFRSIYVNY
jgi:hypothetical protein